MVKILELLSRMILKQKKLFVLRTSIQYYQNLKKISRNVYTNVRRISSVHCYFGSGGARGEVMILPDPAAGETCDTNSRDGQTP